MADVMAAAATFFAIHAALSAISPEALEALREAARVAGCAAPIVEVTGDPQRERFDVSVRCPGGGRAPREERP